MKKCNCGSERHERKEPCLVNDECKGCGLCVGGQITVVWCDNKDCIFGDSDDEG